MEPAIVVTALVLIALVASLVRELVAPSAAMLGALVALMLLDVVEPGMALAGFSSPATFTVAGLFVVARALQMHGGVEQLIERGLSKARSERGVLLRLCSPVALVSAVVANTPLVAALAPVVRGWADRTGRPPSRLLMPLSFATILGGVGTTIGTSTTLVASGIVEARTGEAFSLFEVSAFGVPVAVVGIAMLVWLTPRLLPDRGTDVRLPSERAYSFRLVVEPGGPLDGVALGDAGLRDLDGVFVAALDRGTAGTIPARPDSRLAGGDHLVIVGDVEHARDVPVPGLRHADEHQVNQLEEDLTGLYEAVVGVNSPLLHRTLKQVSFRGRYGAAVLAVQREGSRVEGQLGTLELEAGDLLLLRAGTRFAERWRDEADFAVIIDLDRTAAGRSRRAPLVLAVTLGMVLAAAVGVVSLLEAVLWACIVLIGTRTVRFRDSLEALDLDVLIIIAVAIGLGNTIESSGLAALIADGIAALAGSAGALTALVLLILGTTLLTEVVTNVASAALLVPIAMSAAEGVGADPRGWAVAVAVAASTSFLTPIGYQTNTIVYGLGGYRFGDYWRLGAPLVLLTVVLGALIVPAAYG